MNKRWIKSRHLCPPGRAFTLIELMVVVAIIAFLASIAIPRYFSYYAKAQQVEAAMILALMVTRKLPSSIPTDFIFPEHKRAFITLPENWVHHPTSLEGVL